MKAWKTVLLAAATAQAVTIADCPGYKITGVKTTDNGLTASLALAGERCDIYGPDLKELFLEVKHETNDRLHVLLRDKTETSYQVPESVFPRPGGSTSAKSSNLKFEYQENPFSFQVKRTSGEVLFDTSGAKLVFESQYMHLQTKLPQNHSIYGLGEHSNSFRLKPQTVMTMWAYDHFAIPENSNLYGSHPVYFESRESGSHGVFLLNSNGMDVKLNDDSLNYQIIGGVFDFWFMAGPTPVDVAKQYAEIAGFPALVPYWSLGFQNCRYGSQDIYHTAEIAYNYSKAGLPLEVLWNDIDYMDRRKVFTLDPQRYPLDKVRDFVDYLHRHDQKYVMMVDPGVSYTDSGPAKRGVEDNVFMLRRNGTAFLGVVWPGVTAFPDWFAANITKYWNGEFGRFFNSGNSINLDGIWLDMDEPSSFKCFFPCDDPYRAAIGTPPSPPPLRQNPRPLPGWPCSFQPPGTACKKESRREISAIEHDSGTDNPPQVDTGSLVLLEKRKTGDKKGLEGRDLLYPQYAIRNKAAYRDSWNAKEGGLSNKTIHTNIKSQNGLAHYDTHNLYGTMMGAATYNAMLARRPGKRPFIINRSTFAGGGTKTGHWLGDNLSTWDMYRKSIRTMLNFAALFQYPMTGSDVCGFARDTTEELCARWASLGAFTPFYRNHNRFDAKDQDNIAQFYRWATVTESARKAISIRYRLLDYFYTHLHKNSVDGTPATLPMHFVYPKDKATWGLELQYFYGPGLLVAPVTQEGATSVDVYLPKDTFYDWYTQKPICGKGANYKFTNQNITSIPLLIRSGVILPVRTSSANTTTAVRKQDFELIVPLRADGTAKGELYLDDGETIDGTYSLINFSYKDGKLTVEGSFDYKVPVVVSKVTVLGSGGDACGSGNSGVSSEPKVTKVQISLSKPGVFDAQPKQLFLYSTRPGDREE